MLKIDALNTYYGRSHILQGVSLEVRAGEIVTIVGRNGAGKTTTLKSVMGLLSRVSGAVHFDGHSLLGQPAHMRFSLGLGYVPEHRAIVPGLTVLENIRLGLVASPLRRRETEVIERIASTFPRLKQRLGQEGVTLSGGEQQMLAIARTMASDPKMIILDEPSEGIMPILVDEMFALFLEMKKAGKTILLVEQNVELALKISDRAYVMDQGIIVHQANAADMLNDSEVQERYCSV